MRDLPYNVICSSINVDDVRIVSRQKRRLLQTTVCQADREWIQLVKFSDIQQTERREVNNVANKITTHALVPEQPSTSTRMDKKKAPQGASSTECRRILSKAPQQTASLVAQRQPIPITVVVINTKPAPPPHASRFGINRPVKKRFRPYLDCSCHCFCLGSVSRPHPLRRRRSSRLASNRPPTLHRCPFSALPVYAMWHRSSITVSIRYCKP